MKNYIVGIEIESRVNVHRLLSEGKISVISLYICMILINFNEKLANLDADLLQTKIAVTINAR